MTIPIVAANSNGVHATSSVQSIMGINKADFIRQGFNIVNAYAERYHLTVLQPCDGPGKLADYIWKRYADENGTIPLLPEHTAVRLSSGHIRIIERDSDSGGSLMTHPVPDSDPCPPIEPPDLDEKTAVLPKAFQHSKEPSPSPPPASKQLVHFPSFLAEEAEWSEQYTSPRQEATPRLDYVYPPRGQLVFGPNGENLSYENPSPRWIIAMIEQVRQRREQIEQAFNDSKIELASAVLELQKARDDLNASVAESQRTIERIRNLFGTQRALRILNAKEEVKKKTEGRPDEGSYSSYSGEENLSALSNSRPSSWSSRKSPCSDNHGVMENGAINNVANNSENHVETSDGRGLAVVLSSSSPGRKPTDGILTSPLHTQSKYFQSPLGKRKREEELDSETEVEASILYDHDEEQQITRPKKARLDDAGASTRAPSSRRSSLKRNDDMDVDKSKPSLRVRFAETTSGSLSNTPSDGQTAPKSPPRSKTSRNSTSAATSRRPLVRSTSQLFSRGDGGVYYLKYYPPRSDEDPLHEA